MNSLLLCLLCAAPADAQPAPVTAAASAVRRSSAAAVGEEFDLVPIALERLKSKDAEERRRAAEELGALKDARGAAPLAAALADEAPGVRLAAARALGELKVPETAGRLSALLGKDPDVQTRAAAALSLGHIGGEPAEKALLTALKDAADDVALAAASALTTMRSSRAVEPLAAWLKSPSILRRRAAAGMLGVVGTSKSVSALTKALKDEESSVRLAAAVSLGSLGDPSAVPALKPLLMDTFSPVAVNTAIAMAKLGDRSGQGLGLAYLRHPQPMLRQQGAAIIANIGDAQYGLPAVENALAVESDELTRNILRDTVAQMRRRLGLPESDAPRPPRTESRTGAVPVKVKEVVPTPVAPTKPRR